ncbi:hypothetical protein [Nesterenkonia sandarakina]|uniref:Uncharacterized protein n=1 Tax=Nesterenkonia sandarakina TaxID=272918 RepID=A0A2T0YE98_9MICC|nr:hypothetical protein [Nesterenkonia sandarakina]PRZ13174.1 hypothetical protein BCL67_11649 [Nesterenkonia sandarakina]
MRRPAKLAAISAALLATAHGINGWLQLEETAYLTVLSGFAAVALCTLVGLLLVTAVGLPGEGAPGAPSWIEVLLVALSCSTLLMLVLSSTRSRLRPSPGQDTEPYRQRA